TDSTSAASFEFGCAFGWFRFIAIPAAAATDAGWLATASASALSARTEARHSDRVDDLRYLHSDDRMVLLPRSNFGSHRNWTWHVATNSAQEQPGREHRP